MIARLVGWSVDARWWVAGGTLFLSGLALAVGLHLRLDALPDLTNNQVVVLTTAPGLTPEEVERLITRPLEVSLGGAPSLVEQRSLSRYGISSVTVIFEESLSPWLARQIVAERIGSVSLPAGIARPELAPLTGGLGEIFHLTLSSPSRTPGELLELATYRVAPLLKAVAGVVEVNSWGGAQRTFDLVADTAKLAARGLTLQDVRTSIEAASGVAAGGALPSGSGQVLVRAQARPQSPGEFAGSMISGTSVRAGDIGEVVEGTRLRLGAATANGAGEPVYLMVQMLRDANALEVTKRIQAEMPKVKAALPDDVHVEVVYDRSVLVGATLKTVAMNLLEGGALVLFVLLAFLGSVRAGLLVASVIPLAMAFATALMTLLDVPGNLMSLGALDFGLLVDGAIVLVEGLFHAITPGEALSPQQMRQRIREVAVSSARPVFFSVLVILLVYIPVLSLTGVDGKLFRPMALTVVFALSAALVLSLTWVPAVAAIVLRSRDVPLLDPLPVRLVERFYPKLLGPARSHRSIVAAATALLLLSGGVLLRTRGVEFTPQLDEGDWVIQTTREPEISLEGAVLQALALERVVKAGFPEVDQIVSRIGSPAVATDIMGFEQADVFVKLRPQSTWRDGWSHEQLISAMDAAIMREAPGVELAFTQPIQMRFNELLGGAVTDVAVSIYGDDLGQLRKLSDAIAETVAKVEGAEDVRVLAPPSVPLSTVRPRSLDTAAFGFHAKDVLDAVQAARVGIDVGLSFDGQVPIPLRLRTAETASAWALPNLPLPMHTGGVVQLSRVADIETTDAPALISRRNGERRLVVGFNVRGADLGSVVRQAQERATALSIPAGYRLEWGGQYENLTEASRRLAVVVPVVLALILLVLSVTFSRVRPALIIFSLVPFAGVGGTIALALRGLPVSLPAAIGFIALSGIAVMNGVVWVTRALELQDSGDDAATAAYQAAIARARPVLMTALVAALGFVPMMLAQGAGSEVQRPLATVVVGGLVSSTFLTLFVLPALYPWLAARRKGTPA